MTKHTPYTRWHRSVCALAIGLAVPFVAAPALAEQEEQIEVTSQSEMKQWKGSVSKTLDSALQRAPGRVSTIPDSGIVQITFRLGDDGRAEDLRVYSNSADWSAARMAKYAVRRIDNLAEAPVSNVDDARFMANIIFADDQVQRAKLARVLAKSEKSRLAAAGAEDDVIVLGG